jgi:hypothetical protein
VRWFCLTWDHYLPERQVRRKGPRSCNSSESGWRWLWETVLCSVSALVCMSQNDVMCRSACGTKERRRLTIQQLNPFVIYSKPALETSWGAKSLCPVRCWTVLRPPYVRAIDSHRFVIVRSVVDGLRHVASGLDEERFHVRHGERRSIEQMLASLPTGIYFGLMF